MTVQPALSVDSMVLRFGGLLVLDNVSFDVAPGQNVGLIGPNGAGKTSLINCVTGFYRAESGRVLFEGHAIERMATVNIAALGVARTFQHAEGISGMGARDLLLLGCERELPRGVIRYGFGIGSRRAEREARARVQKVAEEVGIGDAVRRNTPIESLPYGVRKIIDLGRAMVSDPKLLLLDEPVAGLNSDEKVHMAEAITALGRMRSISQVVVDHDIDFVSAVVQKLVVLDAGRKIAEGPVQQVLEDPAVIEAYIGTRDDGHAAVAP
jgi:branched-chain amino acid transport system ATP-binding protein